MYDGSGVNRFVFFVALYTLRYSLCETAATGSYCINSTTVFGFQFGNVLVQIGLMVGVPPLPYVSFMGVSSTLIDSLHISSSLIDLLQTGSRATNTRESAVRKEERRDCF